MRAVLRIRQYGAQCAERNGGAGDCFHGERGTCGRAKCPEKAAGIYATFFSRKAALIDFEASMRLILQPMQLQGFLVCEKEDMEALRAMTLADPDKKTGNILSTISNICSKTGNTLMQDLYTDVIMFIHFAYTDNMLQENKKTGLSWYERGTRKTLLYRNRMTGSGCGMNLTISTGAMGERIHVYADLACEDEGRIEQVPFRWRLHTGRPESYFSIATNIVWKINFEYYFPWEVICRRQPLAQEYDTSVMTMRRR